MVRGGGGPKENIGWVRGTGSRLIRVMDRDAIVVCWEVYDFNSG